MRKQHVEALHPSGFTDRRTYRIAVAAISAHVAATVAVILAELLSGWAALVVLGFVTLLAWIALLLLTIRRLRDAGWSVWWVILMLVAVRPWGASYVFESGAVSLALQWPFVDVLPLLIGLFAPSIAIEDRTI